MKIGRMRSDNVKEYISATMKEIMEPEGVKHELTVPYNPHMNGVAERINKTLFGQIRAMLADVELPLEFWAIAADTSVYLYNKIPIGNRKTIPEQDWTKLLVKVDHLRIFGCVAYVHIPKDKRKKLEPTAWKGIIVGYMGNSLYRIWNPITKKVEMAGSVRFDESQIGLEGRKAPRRPLAELETWGDDEEEDTVPAVRYDADPSGPQGEDAPRQDRPGSPMRPREEVQDPGTIQRQDQLGEASGPAQLEDTN